MVTHAVSAGINIASILSVTGVSRTTRFSDSAAGILEEAWGQITAGNRGTQLPRTKLFKD
jgi:hypothetical protein